MPKPTTVVHAAAQNVGFPAHSETYSGTAAEVIRSLAVWIMSHTIQQRMILTIAIDPAQLSMSALAGTKQDVVDELMDIMSQYTDAPAQPTDELGA